MQIIFSVLGETRPISRVMSGNMDSLDIFKPLDGKSSADLPDLSSASSNASLKVKKNELGLIEISREASTASSVMTTPSIVAQDSCDSSSSDSDDSDDIDLTCRETALDNEESSPEVQPKTAKPKEDEILCCQGCGCYGMAGEFLNSQACNETCQQRILQKNRDKEKKERELLVQKQRREARKQEKLRERKEIEDKAATEAAKAAVAAAKAVKVEVDDDDDMGDASGFTWGRYLDATNAKAAPAKFFDVGIPTERNSFKIGMKMEAIDPEHASLFCVVTVVEVKGILVNQ